MSSLDRPHRVIGAYAAQPVDPAELGPFYREVLAFDGIDGLEISWGSPTWDRDRAIVEDALDGAPRPGRHVVTLVGAEADLATRRPGAGLASTDPRLRRSAVDLVARARRWVRDIASPRMRIVAVELHSFPTVAPDDAASAGEALARSLAEIGSWDWGGTELVVEHCDARHSGRPWRKGLLPLDVEIAAVAAAPTATPIGIAVNWGRSAIEGRDASTPRDHLAQLRRAGCLRGLVFSGATDRPGPFGDAWEDVHPPFHEQLEASIMTRADAEACLEAAGDELLYDGTKIAVRPLDMPLDRRLEILRAGVAALPTRRHRKSR